MMYDDELDELDELDATISCPDCRESIYDDSEQCPHCGWWITDEDERPQRASIRWMVIFVSLLLVLALAWPCVQFLRIILQW